jgi:excisionase family DNA binding protein
VSDNPSPSPVPAALASEALSAVEAALIRAEEALTLARQAVSVAMTGAESSQYVSVRDAARLIGVHRVTVTGWVATGVLESVRIGGRRLILRSSVDAKIAEASR